MFADAINKIADAILGLGGMFFFISASQALRFIKLVHAQLP